MRGSGSVFGIRIQEAPEYGSIIRIRIHNTSVVIKQTYADPLQVEAAPEFNNVLFFLK